ncbi:hypothetical protein [Pengzhenrongella frigida]|uniref:Uncharacterized protein n=1 Tax=Pengzhenrongella frigida TaxID=1259133 RepID=A0A4Q5N1M0_9MICO|nr:hypothetical protein [Cellulomonas sp. HLT2-17]RYV52018.1 hypothetical protein EUA98_05470 [Cellulomonas sp. HLT2-17]
MRLSLTFPEALEFALLGGALPPVLREVTATGSTVRADVDLRAVPAPPFALRALATIAPTVRVDATFRSFAGGRATFDLVIKAGAVPVQKLLNQLTPLLNSGLRAAHLPAGLVVVEQGPHGEPQAVLDLQSAVALRATGVTITAFEIADASVDLTATVHQLALRPSASTR